MTGSTIMAVYTTTIQAEGALDGLRRAQVPENAISQHKGGTNIDGTPASGVTETNVTDRTDFWGRLLGTGHLDATAYNRTLPRGSMVITVTNVDAAERASIASILESHDPIDINENAS